MKIKSALVLALIFISTASFAWAFDKEPDGFRGIKWGTSINDYKGMVLIETDGDTKFYKKKGDKLSIGEAELNKITYIFYKGKFYSVFIKYEGIGNFDKLKETFTSQYGAPNQPNQYMDDYYWYGDKVDISFSFTQVTDKGYVLTSYTPIEQEREADKKAKAQQGASDL